MNSREKISPAFSTQYNGLANQIISDIFVSDTNCKIKAQNTEAPNAYKCKGLWDTGATNTAISAKIVSALNLPIISKTPIIGVNGTFETTTHMIDLWLTNFLVIRRIPVAKGIFPHNFDILIGMDIITKEDFAISNYQGKTLFSFRSPSMGNTDYVV